MVKRVLLVVFAVAVAAALFLAPYPASAITNGQPDDNEHPYVGELIFFDADAVDPRFNDPGSWFSCSATMLSATVIVTAGHCTFGVGENGESTTTDGGDGSGGNDIWFDPSESAHFDGFPASSNYGPDENHQRYLDRAAFLNASPFWHRGTSHPHPEFDPAEFFVTTPASSCSTSRFQWVRTAPSRSSTTSTSTRDSPTTCSKWSAMA